MATGPIETHLHRSFNWENGAPGPQEGPRGRSANCGNGLFAQCVRLRSEINPFLLLVLSDLFPVLNELPRVPGGCGERVWLVPVDGLGIGEGGLRYNRLEH